MFSFQPMHPRDCSQVYILLLHLQFVISLCHGVETIFLVFLCFYGASLIDYFMLLLSGPFSFVSYDISISLGTTLGSNLPLA